MRDSKHLLPAAGLVPPPPQREAQCPQSAQRDLRAPAMVWLCRSYDDVEISDISLVDYIAIKASPATVAVANSSAAVRARALCGRPPFTACPCFMPLAAAQGKAAVFAPHTAGRYARKRLPGTWEWGTY